MGGSGMSKCFIVLGMHRSATSLIAGSLNKNDVVMGFDYIKADTGNPKGYWEDKDFLDLNKMILNDVGGSWKNPPTESAILKNRSAYADEIEKLVKKREQYPLWGWKDPRTTLTIKLFLPHIKNPHFICCLRDPSDVAKSLSERNGMKFDKAMRLAKIYNDRMMEFMKEWADKRYY